MGTEKPLSVLYLSYDGLTDPLGRSQVLAYLKELSGEHLNFVIVSYDKKEKFVLHQEEIRAICAERNIDWRPLSYTKSPPIFSTIYDVLRGWRLISKLHRSKKFDVVHCRGYITAILGLRAKKRWGSRLIFDMRGFWVDEKKESGNWAGIIYRPVYRYFKKLEKKFFSQADTVISLTEAGKQFILDKGWSKEEKVKVIPTCVDFDVFPPFDASIRHQVRAELNLDQNTPVFIYSGSLGGNYPISQLIDIYQLCQRHHPNGMLIILSQTPEEEIMADAAWEKYKMDYPMVLKAPYTEVHRYLMAADYGIIFYQEGMSNLGRAPTKLAEYWAAGLSVVCDPQVGDLGSYLESIDERKSGKTLEEVIQISLSDNEVDKAYLYSLARKNFDLNAGVKKYRSIYLNLMQLTT